MKARQKKLDAMAVRTFRLMREQGLGLHWYLAGMKRDLRESGFSEEFIEEKLERDARLWAEVDAA